MKMPLDKKGILKQKPNRPKQIFDYPGDGKVVIRRHELPGRDEEIMTIVSELKDG